MYLNLISTTKLLEIFDIYKIFNPVTTAYISFLNCA